MRFARSATLVHLGRSALAAATICLVALPLTSARAEAPRVVTSIKPVQSLVAAVMRGVGQPGLIVKGAASPHDYALKPSDARALEHADLVFWIGPAMEGFLAKPLAAIADKATAIPLMKAKGVQLLPAREGGVWEPDDDEPPQPANQQRVNPHVWLEPGNARAMVDAIADALAKQDPADAATYRANAARTNQDIDALGAALKTTLVPVVAKPFVVFHDAYQYFETHYGLNAVGSITVDPERRPSAKRLSQIRARIDGIGAVCVFAEPEFEPALVDTIVEGTPARKGVLDPIGADLKEGPELWFTLMRDLASSLTRCLAS